MTELPAWLQPLAAAALAVEPEQMSRFLPPEDGSGRDSAVLIALCLLADEPAVLLIERAADLRKHAGQVAFPGGAVDPDDADEIGAALREAAEEVGLDPSSVTVFAKLPAVFIPVTGFVVTPVLAWWHEPHPVEAVDPLEVAACAVVPISDARRSGAAVPGSASVRLVRARLRGGRAVHLGLHRRAARLGAHPRRVEPPLGHRPRARPA